MSFLSGGSEALVQLSMKLEVDAKLEKNKNKKKSGLAG